MKTISAPTLDDLLREVLECVLKRGKPVDPSRGANRELLAVALRLSNPRARLSHTEKKGKVFSALGELMWYLSGSNDAKFVGYYAPRYLNDAEKDGTIHGAYGPRLMNTRGHNQLQNVIQRLKQKPSTRRAVIQLFDAGDLAGDFRDIPCTCTLQFFIRGAKLHMVTTMRSNDAFIGLPHDVFAFTMLQEMISQDLGYEVGTYNHFAGSLHLYDDNVEAARRYLEEGWQTVAHASMPCLPKGDPWPSVATLVKAEKAIRTGKQIPREVETLDGYWQDLVRLLRIFRHFKSGERAEITKLRRKMIHPIYDQYIKVKETGKRTVPRSGQPDLFPADGTVDNDQES